MTQEDLKKERDCIDELDLVILDLLNRRARHALTIGQIKKQLGKEIGDTKREQELLDRLQKENQGPLNSDEILAIFQEIIAQFKVLQQRNKGSSG